MVMVRIGLAVIVVGCAPALAQPSSRVDARLGRLVIFVAPDASPLARSFQKDTVPAIVTLARRLNIPVRLIDIHHGAPEEVTITPLLVYQNDRGRSIYQGRYSTLQRIRNFLRTSRVATQGAAALARKHIPVWRTGRAVIAAPVKVAPVTGHKPFGYDTETFVAEATRAVQNGFKRFQYVDRIELRRSDRLFYMDFNPWVSPDGILFLSVSLFSQFHCKKPIMTRPGKALTGPWKERKRIFTQAAAALEEAVLQQMAESPYGDGFDPVPSATATVTWESLGLALPAATSAIAKRSQGPPLGQDWFIEEDPPGTAHDDSVPQITFRFPSPLDAYAGEVGKVSGELHLPPDLSFERVQGVFVAYVKTVTMGDPDLDHAIQESSFFLNEPHYPTARFVIESIETDPTTPHGERLVYGELMPATMTGRFTLKGVTIPLSVRTLFEPIVHEDGQPRLVMHGAFTIHLSPFHIDGPDPPEDGSHANDTLLFDFNFTLRQHGSSSRP